MKPILLAAPLLLLPLLAPALAVPSADPQGVHLASLAPGDVLAVGRIEGDACVFSAIQGHLLPGEAARFVPTPDCRLVASPEFAVCLEPGSTVLDPGACAVVSTDPPLLPDPAAVAGCVRADPSCALQPAHHEVDTEVSPTIVAPTFPPGPCLNYAMHATVDTGETLVRVGLVWEGGCGAQPNWLYGTYQCATPGVGPQPGHWTILDCDHHHVFTPPLEHEHLGKFVYDHTDTQTSSAYHEEMAGVHADVSGGWCVFSLQFNPYSNFLLATCAPGP